MVFRRAEGLFLPRASSQVLDSVASFHYFTIALIRTISALLSDCPPWPCCPLQETVCPPVGPAVSPGIWPGVLLSVSTLSSRG